MKKNKMGDLEELEMTKIETLEKTLKGEREKDEKKNKSHKNRKKRGYRSPRRGTKKEVFLFFFSDVSTKNSSPNNASMHLLIVFLSLRP